MTTRVQPSSRHSPRAGRRRAQRHHLGVPGRVVLGLAHVAAARRPPRRTASSTTAPIGTSPVASAARASVERGEHRLVPAIGRGHRTVTPWSGPRRRRRARRTRAGGRCRRAARRGRGRRRRAGVARSISGRPRSASRSRSPAGTWSSSSSGIGRPRKSSDRGGQLPLVGGGDVGEQHPGRARPVTRTITKKSSSRPTRATAPASPGKRRSARDERLDVARGRRGRAPGPRQRAALAEDGQREVDVVGHGCLRAHGGTSPARVARPAPAPTASGKPCVT